MNPGYWFWTAQSACFSGPRIQKWSETVLEKRIRARHQPQIELCPLSWPLQEARPGGVWLQVGSFSRAGIYLFFSTTSENQKIPSLRLASYHTSPLYFVAASRLWHWAVHVAFCILTPVFSKASLCGNGPCRVQLVRPVQKLAEDYQAITYDLDDAINSFSWFVFLDIVTFILPTRMALNPPPSYSPILMDLNRLTE